MYSVIQFDSLVKLEHYLNVTMNENNQELIKFNPIDLGNDIHYICIFKSGKSNDN